MLGRLGRLYSDEAVVAYAHWVIRWRWAVIALTLVLAVAAISGGRSLSFSTNYRVFFGDENPQLQAYEALQNIYTQDDNILLVIRPAAGDVFTSELLGAIRDLTDAAWQIPYATRIDSLANFQHSFAEGDDLTVQDLVPRSDDLGAAEIARIRDVALREPLLVDRLVSPDGTTTAVNVTLTLPLVSENETPEAMAYVRDLAEQFRLEHPDVRVAVTGLVALSHAFTESSFDDLTTLIPLMYLALLLAMIVLLRSFSGTLATMSVIGLSAATAMGIAGWLGIQITPPSAIAPTIILTIAIADSIHVLVAMFREMRTGSSKHAALVESLRINFQPVFLTSLTTVIGFLSLNFSDAPPFGDLGNITAMGVIAAWVYSILFLPALMAVLPVRIRPRAHLRASAMDRLAEFVIGRRKPLLIGMTVLVLGLAITIPRIELNDQFVNYFDPSIEFRADTDFAMDNLSGIYQAQWSLPAGETGGISDPTYLARVERFADWLNKQPGVVQVQSLTDILRRLNKNMHGDDEAWFRLPEERDLAAQYLLLFEMSLPYGLDLNNQINVDKSALRLVATLENITTNDLRALDRKASAWLAQNLPSAAHAGATGPFVMFAYISERNIEGMLTGAGLAFLLISLSLVIAFRSIRHGLVSLEPNFVPLLMAFGIWSVFVGQIGLASSMVAATSLGIIVDATVHFLSKYLRARRERSATSEEAVRYAFTTVGTALWVAAAILIAGFAVLFLSTFEINRVLGLLTAITLAVALVADFLLLPPLLMAIDGRRADKRVLSRHDPSPVTQTPE
ncbi:MAG: MMPL family transporter [Proteobacteria bacterium]|nr:MMPL family transporter [Pseudomonadota bacterium]